MKLDDQLVIHMGTVIPFDGTVVAGEAMVNQASLTGESVAVRRAEGSSVYAGTVVEEEMCIRDRSSKDAKKLYTNCTAAVLRAKECVMKTVTTVQENATDIYEGAKEINEERAAAEEAFEDAAEDETTTDFKEETETTEE